MKLYKRMVQLMLTDITPQWPRDQKVTSWVDEDGLDAEVARVRCIGENEGGIIHKDERGYFLICKDSKGEKYNSYLFYTIEKFVFVKEES